MKGYIPAFAEQDITNELGTLHHNTVSVPLGSKVAVEPRPTFPDNSAPASGDYGRGAFIHKGVPLYVTEDQIANNDITTAITSTNLNPLAKACFGILDDGTDKITIVQNAGFLTAEGSLYYASDVADLSIEKYTEHPDNFTTTAAAQENNLFFKPDGTRFYTQDTDNTDLVYQYSLSTAWDITTASYDSVSYDSSEVGTNLGSGLFIGDSGTKMYLTNSSTDIVYQYTLSTAWDLSTASYASKSFDVSTQDAGSIDIAFSTDGSVMIMLGSVNDAVFEYSLSTPWDVSTASYVDSFSITSNSPAPRSFVFNSDGTRMFVGDAISSSTIDEYTLSTGFDVSSASYTNTLSITPNDPKGLCINNDTGDIYFIDTARVVQKFTAGSTFTVVSDADAPGSTSNILMARGCPVLNGYVFCLGAETGTIYNSDINSVTAWTSTNFTTAEREADYGVFLGKQRDHIVYIGTRSIEFFYDAANASGSPLARRADVSYNVGSVFPNSCVQYGDDIWFIGTDAEGHTDLYQLTDFELNPILHPYLQTKLRELDVNAHKNVYTNEAENFKQVITAIATPRNSVLLILTINGTTYMFQPETGHISEWYPGADVASSTGLFPEDWSTNYLFPVMDAYSNTPQGTTDYVIMSNGYVTSLVYNGDLDDFAGTSTAAPCFFYMPKWNGDTLEKKRVAYYQVDHYPNLDSSITSSNYTLAWLDIGTSRDFGASLTDADFTNGRALSSNYSAPKMFRGGTARERVHKFSFTAEKSQLVAGLIINYEIVGL